MAECETISVITLVCFLCSSLYTRIINIDGFASKLNCKVLESSLGVTVRMLFYALQAGGFLPL